MINRRLFLSIVGQSSALLSMVPYATFGKSLLSSNKDFDYDLIVIGGTPGGVACATRAAREGLKVLVTNHNHHFGGMLSNGMGVWDTLYEGKRSPVYDELRQHILDFYKNHYGPQSRQYKDALPGKTGHTNGKFESWVAEQEIRKLLEAHKNIDLLGGVRLKSAVRKNSRIESVQFDRSGKEVSLTAKIFADCTYEGDLMPLVDTPHTIGRESIEKYNEPHAGEIYMRLLDEEDNPQTAREKRIYEGLNIRIFGKPQEKVMPESTGKGDDKVQAFNFRTILTKDPAKRIRPLKPANYNREWVKDLRYNVMVKPIPNQKASWNRPQLLEVQRNYVVSSSEKRREIEQTFKEATISLLYYLQNDPEVNPDVQKSWREYGFSSDEFTDNDHFPHEIYVREGRRLVGQYVFTEHDALLSATVDRTRVHHDSIGITEWYMDNHAVHNHRVVNNSKEGWIMKEGKFTLHKETFPGQVPYRSLIAQDLDNLLVPVCLSSSHVAWGTVRLEPTWMNIAESAGVAAAQAVKAGQSLHAIDVEQLLVRLAETRVMISFFNDVESKWHESWIPAAQYFGTKGFFNTYDVFPEKELDKNTADQWLKGIKMIMGNDLKAMQLAETIQNLEGGKLVTNKEWNARLSEMGFKTSTQKDGSQNEPVLRKEALIQLFEGIKK